jgi:hypothetical protein
MKAIGNRPLIKLERLCEPGGARSMSNISLKGKRLLRL